MGVRKVAKCPRKHRTAPNNHACRPEGLVTKPKSPDLKHLPILVRTSTYLIGTHDSMHNISHISFWLYPKADI